MTWAASFSVLNIPSKAGRLFPKAADLLAYPGPLMAKKCRLNLWGLRCKTVLWEVCSQEMVIAVQAGKKLFQNQSVMMDPGQSRDIWVKIYRGIISGCLHIKISHHQYDLRTGDAKPPPLQMPPVVIHARNRAGDLLTATGAPQPGSVWALRSHMSICRKDPAAEGCLRRVQRWKMLRCIATWKKSAWRKRQALFFHTTEVYKSLSLDSTHPCKLTSDIVWAQGGQSAFGYTWAYPGNSAVQGQPEVICVCTAFAVCRQPAHCIPAASSLHPGRGRGEGGGVCFSQSCSGSCTVPMHSTPLPLCQPLPRVAPGGHNKRLVSLFQLVANRVAWLQGLHMFISICNHTFLDAFLIPGKGHISTACWHKSHRQLQKRWDNKYTLTYIHTLIRRKTWHPPTLSRVDCHMVPINFCQSQQPANRSQMLTRQFQQLRDFSPFLLQHAGFGLTFFFF